MSVDLLADFFRMLSSLGTTPRPLDGSGCCRRRQTDDSRNCRSVRERLKCFSNVVNRQREMCCPISPGFPELYVADCACRCRRVFSSRTFWALCNRNVLLTSIRRFTRNLATSCSCRADRGPSGRRG
ncbi:hypothetical protein ElyMa_002861900 [Elysia marginata]|uniref:CTCK domain-containing protein n=1 Tax=Elysia marginata TaxID=1093978 RepID=A0AAV4HVW2_9GAST|nr:hypothetical protein ElyMa_002861900 [Elysia marginata]